MSIVVKTDVRAGWHHVSHLRYEELVPLQLDTHVRRSVVDERLEPVLKKEHAVFNAQENPHLLVSRGRYIDGWRWVGGNNVGAYGQPRRV